jgi:peptidoglycan/LPS O-acetylase OafA/YrhL
VFLQGSVVLRYGTTGYDEGTWFIVRLLQSACLLGACWSVRHGAGALIWASRSVRVVLTALAAVCGVLLTAATVAQWDHSRELIDTGYVADRTPLAVWLAGLVLGPIVITVGLAARRSTAAHLTLATIATLSTVAYLSQTFIIDEVFDSDGSRWARTAVAYIPLAAVAWSTATRAARPGDPARHSTRRSSTTAQASTGHVSEADS